VKLVTRLMPFLLVMIPFWGIYSQMSTAFQNQGCQMNLNMGTIQVPVSALNAFDTIAILLMVPLFDLYLYPYMKKIGHPPTMLGKIGAGFVFAMLAMVLAALIEIWRLKQAPSDGDYYDTSARDNVTPCQNIDDYNPYQYQDWYSGVSDTDKPMHCSQICSTIEDSTLALSCISCDTIPQMSNLSVFWQIPQFFLVGVAEILASITSLEFFYSQVGEIFFYFFRFSSVVLKQFVSG
jgi:peptide/histidine transporter 3/4